jgi:hypothetical protein
LVSQGIGNFYWQGGLLPMGLANFRIKMCLAGLAISFFSFGDPNFKIGLEFFGIELGIGSLSNLFCRQGVEFLVQIPLIKIMFLLA